MGGSNEIWQQVDYASENDWFTFGSDPETCMSWIYVINRLSGRDGPVLMVAGHAERR